MYFTILLLSLGAIFLCACLMRWLKRDRKFYEVPGPPGVFLFGNGLDFLTDHVKIFYLFRRLANTYRDLFRIKLGPKKIVIIYNPEDVETLISGTKYNKKGDMYDLLQPWLNEGLLLSDGSKWHQRRKILTPAFHFNILQQFNTVLQENCRTLVKDLKKELDKPQTDITHYITNFALHSICETAMGIKLDDEQLDMGRKYKNAIYKMGKYCVTRATRVWLFSNYIFPYTELGRKQKKVLELMSNFRDKVIDRRRMSHKNETIIIDSENNEESIELNGKKRLAMLDLLLQAEKEGTINAQGIGEEVDTFMFEGHDTVATALQFTFMLMANYKEAQDRVVKECHEIFGSSDRSVTMADLSQMKYLDCCIKESMRLYPPVFFIIRNLRHPLQLKDYEIPANTDCAVLIYDLHRRSDQFSEPLEFRPERFLEKTPTWHPYSYIPFSAGPRNCIGQKYAIMEMKLAVSTVLREYELTPVTKDRDIVFISDFILRATKPIYVAIRKREMASS